MAQTLTRLLVHIVFSTKNRAAVISEEVEAELYAYIGGICRNLESPLLDAGGAADHVHLLVSQSKNIALSELLKNIKKDSSFWIKTKGSAFRGLHWQHGYSAFSIGESGLPALRRYFAEQKEHHRRVTFQDELRAFLKKYNVPYDERYVWV